jgi:hypothetical protein
VSPAGGTGTRAKRAVLKLASVYTSEDLQDAFAGLKAEI